MKEGGTESPSSGALPPGRRIGGFRIESLLGRGGMGEVYLAFDQDLDRHVAIKRIRGDLLDHPDARPRFRREARLAARLTHAHVVQVFGFLSLEADDFLVMEYVPGSSLSERLRRRQEVDTRTAVRWLSQVADGLAAAHQKGLVHRDLKAENVLITPAGDVKMLDFGLARSLEPNARVEPLTRSGMMLGTLRVMSPEQAAGGRVDERSDLFSLGVLAYELLAGRSPFEGATPEETLTRILTAPPPALAGPPGGVPEALASLVARLLAKAADHRPSSARQVATELSAMLGRLPGDSAGGVADSSGTSMPPGFSQTPTDWPIESPRPSPPPVPASPPPAGGVSEPGRRRLSKRHLVAAVAILVLAVAGIFWWPHPEPIRVAVEEPRLAGAGGSGTGAALAVTAVRESSLGALTRLEGVVPIDPSHTRVITGDTLGLARAVSADEVAVSEVHVEGDRCRISLRRVSGVDGTVLWSESFEAPAGRRDLLLLAEAVELRWQRAYAGRAHAGGEKAVLRPRPVSDEAYGDFLELQAEIHAGGGRGAEAQLADLRPILAAAPGFLAARLLAADLELNLFTSRRLDDHLERAREDVARALSLAPEDPRAIYRAFRLAVVAGDFELAAQRLQAFERASPGDVEVEVARALLAESRGELGHAVGWLESAVARYPSWPNLYRLARLEQKIGRIEAARGHLRQLLEGWPDSPWGLELLANLELQYGDLDDAEALLRRLISARPARPYWNNLGLSQFLRRQLADAADSYQAALELDPDHPFVLLNLADCRWAAGEHEAARSLYRRVLEVLEKRPVGDGPNGYESLLRAQCLARLGRAQEAVESALGTLQEFPEDSEVSYQAAVVYAVVGDLASAKVSAKRAVELGLQPRWLTIPAFERLRGDPAFEALLEPAAGD